ncbi:PAS domain-containing protein [Hymenobacter sp. RP-2-7]|uniref:histidine kinase n=1 Tax=Hymenobacter polaris TaxID=2682546 RepID=A0A7Y0FKZ2_9BACT|nr:ATP-binding protein [Hymenobacter polaris]NML63839.1 PAS domain-containing protein [Hymenobacter polaris]
MLPLTSADDLARENEELRQRLREAEELVAAVRSGAVDGLALPDAGLGPRFATREGADYSYRVLVEQMSEGAALLSAEGLVLYANVALAQLLGYPLATVLGGELTPYVPAQTQEYWAALLREGWQNPTRGEVLLRTAAGELFACVVSVSALFLHETKVLAVLVTDLSEGRRLRTMQAQVAAQSDQLNRQTEEIAQQKQVVADTSRILEGIPQIAWSADATGHNYYVNQRWVDFAGDNSASFARQLRERTHPDDRAAVLAQWLSCVRTGEPFELELRVRNAAGEYRWLLARALPSRDEHGWVRQWIGTYTDIHEHKLAQARLQLAQRQLRDKNNQLSRVNVDLDTFVYAASHDLKQPVNNIDGLLQALLDELPPERSVPVQDILRLMRSSITRFQHTIDQLTDVTQVHRQHSAAATPVLLDKVVRGVALDLAPLVQRAGAELVLDVQDSPPVLCSEKNLRGVIYNLLSNALKYRSPDRPPRVVLRACPAGDYVRLSVEDNGLGLDAASQQKLFGMFQRLHAHVEGAGIGLYMVKKLVENVGGRVEVASELGVGSTFTVYLPRPDVGEKASSAPA